MALAMSWSIVGCHCVPLDVSGSPPYWDLEMSGNSTFRYFYSESTNRFAPVPEPSGLTLTLLTAAAIAHMRRMFW